MTMQTKVIVLDIDGTLLNHEKRITEKTREVLIQAQENGHRIILASGRPTSGMFPFAKQLRMEKHHGLLVSFNGACVTDCESGATLFSQAIPLDLAKQVLTHVKGYDVVPMITKDDYLYVRNAFSKTLNFRNNSLNIVEYEAHGNGLKICEVDDLVTFADFPIYKILLAGEPEYLQLIYNQIREPFQTSLSSMFTAPIYYEFTAQGIDKAKALDSVLSPLGIRKDQIIAFGDGHNDLSLIGYAGTGIAMGNAVMELKEIADRITLSNDEDGIAFALDTLLDPVLG